MTDAAQNQAALRAVEARLASTARMLLLRQCARTLPAAVTAAAVVASLLLVLAVLLPRALFGGALISAPAAVAAGLMGGLAALFWQLRRLRMPTLVEAALALESRLEGTDASLATLLQAQGAFRAPLLGRAQAELATALAAPGPSVISTRGLIAAPLTLIAAAGLAALGWQSPLVEPNGVVGGKNVPATAGLAAVNVATGRDAADANARAEAMGLQKTATELESAARALRQAATQPDANAALDKARAAMGQAKTGTPLNLPAEAPAEANARARLADDIEAAAGGLRREAEVKGTGGGGQDGSGGSTDTNTETRFVAFPKVAAQAGPDRTEADLVGQSPARRALAERATK